MKLSEFHTPQSSAAADITYVLNNAPVSTGLLTKILRAIKPKEPVKTPQPAAQQVQQPTQTTDEPVVTESAIDLKAELLQVIETAPPEKLEEIAFYIKLDAFRNLANQVIAKKIHAKRGAITIRIHQTLASLAGQIPVRTMVEFLEKCLEGGVIDVPAMINSSTEGTAGIPTSDIRYVPIIKALFMIDLGSAAAVGKGEVGMAFAGINTIKGESDITVGSMDVEVKASTAGTDFFLKGAKGYGKHMHSALKLFVDTVNSAGANLTNSNKVNKGGIAQLNNDWNKALTPFFIKLGADKVRKLLMQVLRHIYPEKEIAEFATDIHSSVNEDGSIDYKKLTLATAELAFDYYQTMENHHGILMLNVTRHTYSYQTEARGFAQLVPMGLVTQTSAIDFREANHGALTFKLK